MNKTSFSQHAIMLIGTSKFQGPAFAMAAIMADSQMP